MGAGLSHALVLVLVPISPQDTEQGVQSSQLAQLPCTVDYFKTVIGVCMTRINSNYSVVGMLNYVFLVTHIFKQETYSNVGTMHKREREGVGSVAGDLPENMFCHKLSLP